MADKETDIAVLGWGSMVWKPEPVKLKDRWHFDGPLFPVEFARITYTGNLKTEQLTLVPHPGAKKVPVLWAHAAHPDLLNAMRALAGRQGCTLDFIGYIRTNSKVRNCRVVPEIHEEIRAWANRKFLDAVIWLDLPSNFFEKTGGLLTEYNVLEYLRKLESHGNREARAYVQKAPPQIKTRLRDAMVENLGWRR